MKNIYSIIFILASLFTTTSSAANLKILVSINPIYSLVKNITNGLSDTSLLINAQSSPHNYQLKPSDIKKIQDADIIIIVDDEFEIFLAKYLSKTSLKAKVIRLIHIPSLITLPSRNIKVLNIDQPENKKEETDSHEKHLHEHHHHENSNHNHKHHDHEHHHKAHNIDLHIWTDTLNAQILVQELATILGEYDLKNKNQYSTNAHKTIKKLHALDMEIAKILTKGIQNQPFIVFHDAYQYLEKRYNLKNAGSIAGNNFIYGSKTMKNLKNNIEKNGIKCIFAEPQFSDYFMKKVAKNTGTNVGYLDIEGGNFRESIKPEELYFFMMKQNAKNIYDCLSLKNEKSYLGKLIDKIDVSP